MANGFKLGKRSRQRLVGVHQDLVRVVELAIARTEVDFGVIEGVRTKEKQATLVASGASWTMDSRHITGHAVDLGAFIGAELRWDSGLYHKIKRAMFSAAAELGVKIRWGGDWDRDGDSSDERKFDGPHFELERSAYP